MVYLGWCCGKWPNHKACDSARARIGCCVVTTVLFLVITGVLLETHSASGAWPDRAPDPETPTDTLEYGIRWYSKGNVRNPGFDQEPPLPNAPTLLYCHGWQKNSIAGGLLANYNYKRIDSKYGIDSNLADVWIEKGWNVGLFYWTQLADEPLVTDAEAKIWTSAGPQQMRWRKGDGSFSTQASPNVSVADLLVRSYRKSMEANPPPEIRLAGHSLGSQVVGRATQLLSELADQGDIAPALLPEHAIIMDPFMSKGGRDYLDDLTIGEKIVTSWKYALSVKTSLIFTLWQSSDTNTLSGNGNDQEYTDLAKLATMVRMKEGWINTLDLTKFANQHVSAMPMYMESVKRATAPGAGASDAEQRALMGKGVVGQASGVSTFTSADDTFVTVPWATVGKLTGPAFSLFVFVFVMMFVLGILAVVMLLCMCCCGVRRAVGSRELKDANLALI